MRRNLLSVLPMQTHLSCGPKFCAITEKLPSVPTWVRLCAGHHRQKTRTGDHAVWLAADGGLCLDGHDADIVLGGGKPGWDLHGLESIGRACAGRLFLACGSRGGILWAMGRGDAAVCGAGAVNVRGDIVGEWWQSPDGDADYGGVFYCGVDRAGESG